MKKVKVGVVQATPALFDLAGSIKTVDKWLLQSKEASCELVLFPESFLPCYPRGIDYDAVVGKRTDKSRNQWLDYWNAAIEIGSPEFKLLSETIAKYQMMVAIGVTEKVKIGGSLYCSLWYFDKNGTFLGKHQKIKPTGLERYIWAESDGSTLVSFETKLGKIGGLICWENYMPLARMSMYSKGVEIYLAPTADSRESWQATLQHIALEGRCFVLSANQFVKKSDYPPQYQEDLKDENEIMCTGGSVIMSPMGEILAGPLYNEEGLLTAELDFEVLAKSKLDFDVVGHYARNEIFEFKVNKMPETVLID